MRLGKYLTAPPFLIGMLIGVLGFSVVVASILMFPIILVLLLVGVIAIIILGLATYC